MSIQLNQDIFQKTLLAGLVATSGLILRKGGKHYYAPRPNQSEFLGKVLLTLGWIGVAYYTGVYRRVKMSNTHVISCFIIYSTMMTMMDYKQQKNSMPQILPLLYVMAWLVLGYSMTNKQHGLAAAVIVLTSMFLILPVQRQKVIVDGPGYAMIALAWVLLAASHATVVSVDLM